MGERCEPILNLLNVSKIAAHILKEDHEKKTTTYDVENKEKSHNESNIMCD